MSRRNVSNRAKFFVVALLTSGLFGCEGPNRPSLSKIQADGSSGESPLYYSVDTKAHLDPMRKKLGAFFLVEQGSSEINSQMLLAIQNHPPGGIVFWNPNQFSGSQFRETIRRYSTENKVSGGNPILYSIDYEGGALRYTISNKDVPGIQRVTREMTALAHPQWLGRSLEVTGGKTQLCFLHGQIMSKELKSIGVNYPLASVSDLGNGLFFNRGVSQNEINVSTCLKAVLDGFDQTQKVIFVTKHFPGLGSTAGDTHDGTVRSRISQMSEFDRNLKPFHDLISYSQSKTISFFGILAGHAVYDIVDRDKTTTESKAILNQVLRQQLGYQGVIVSDAMWMGEYGKLNTSDRVIVYLNSFLSGMDFLMIPGSMFAPSIELFRAVWSDDLDAKTKIRIQQKTGKNWEEIRALFQQRVQQSLARLELAQKQVGYAIDSLSAPNVRPDSLTAPERQIYRAGLQALGHPGL